MIRIRAHHLLCIPRFKGGGYNKEIRGKIFNIQKEIKNNKKIKVISECDEICKSCPFKNNNKCEKEQGINKNIKIQDKKVLRSLKIKNNSIINAQDIINLSIGSIDNKELVNICKGCDFLQSCLKQGLNKSLVKLIT